MKALEDFIRFFGPNQYFTVVHSTICLAAPNLSFQRYILSYFAMVFLRWILSMSIENNVWHSITNGTQVVKCFWFFLEHLMVTVCAGTSSTNVFGFEFEYTAGVIISANMKQWKYWFGTIEAINFFKFCTNPCL